MRPPSRLSPSSPRRLKRLQTTTLLLPMGPKGLLLHKEGAAGQEPRPAASDCATLVPSSLRLWKVSHVRFARLPRALSETKVVAKSMGPGASQRPSASQDPSRLLPPDVPLHFLISEAMFVNKKNLIKSIFYFLSEHLCFTVNFHQHEGSRRVSKQDVQTSPLSPLHSHVRTLHDELRSFAPCLNECSNPFTCE